MPICLADVYAARRTIAGIAARTPLIPSAYLSERAGVPVLLKMETMQPTGAFKLRGAVNAVFNAPAGTSTVTCCSTGNHGRSVAYAARERKLRATICMSSLVPQNKIDRIASLGADIRIIGESQDDAMAECLKLGQEDGCEDISPFDNPHVICGQATIALEILEDCPETGTVLVPLSGGGLAGGIAMAAKAIRPSLKIIGISMDRGAAMKASVEAGKPVEVTEVPSLADSLGGGIGLNNKLSFELCKTLLDDIILVTEEEIYNAMQVLYFEDSHVAEGASVVGIAALLAGKLAPSTGPMAMIITGRNVDMTEFTDVITGRSIELCDYRIEGHAYGA